MRICSVPISANYSLAAWCLYAAQFCSLFFSHWSFFMCNNTWPFFFKSLSCLVLCLFLSPCYLFIVLFFLSNRAYLLCFVVNCVIRNIWKINEPFLLLLTETNTVAGSIAPLPNLWCTALYVGITKSYCIFKVVTSRSSCKVTRQLHQVPACATVDHPPSPTIHMNLLCSI